MENHHLSGLEFTSNQIEKINTEMVKNQESLDIEFNDQHMREPSGLLVADGQIQEEN